MDGIEYSEKPAVDDDLSRSAKPYTDEDIKRHTEEMRKEREQKKARRRKQNAKAVKKYREKLKRKGIKVNEKFGYDFGRRMDHPNDLDGKWNLDTGYSLYVKWKNFKEGYLVTTAVVTTKRNGVIKGIYKKGEQMMTKDHLVSVLQTNNAVQCNKGSRSIHNVNTVSMSQYEKDCFDKAVEQYKKEKENGM